MDRLPMVAAATIRWTVAAVWVGNGQWGAADAVAVATLGGSAATWLGMQVCIGKQVGQQVIEYLTTAFVSLVND